MNHKITAALAALVAGLALAACSSGGGSTATAAPVRTAAPSATSSAAPRATLTASQVAKAMGTGSFQAYTAENDPNHLLGRHNEYTSKVNWSKGAIEVFSGAPDAKARDKYVSAFTCPIGDGYDYLDGTALLRLGCALTPDQAKASEALFKKTVAAA